MNKFDRAKKILREWRKNNKWRRSISSARERCNNPNNISYSRYGARGIKCFLTMIEAKTLWDRDNGEGMDKPSIDRINPDGDYTFGNCRFIEMEDNRRGNRGKYFFFGPDKECVHGHEYTKENTEINPEGWRRCMTCYAARTKRKADKRKMNRQPNQSREKRG